MEQITFECETITPMFLAGADGKRAELRPPSIKGAMRFWWRAMNGHLGLKELKEREAEIFGDTNRKAAFSIQLKENNLVKGKYSPLLHNPRKQFKKECFMPSKNSIQNFVIRLVAKQDIINKVEDLFKIVTLLGGLGKRSRRGFGSVKITKINGKDFNFDYSFKSISDLLNVIHPEGFEPKSDRIIMKYTPHTDSNYSYIKEIQIGSNSEDFQSILKTISEESSKNDCYYTGFAEKIRENNRNKAKRFASPIFVSVIPDGNQVRPIITTLNCAFEDNVPEILNKERKKNDCSTKFKNAILEKEVKNG